MPKFIDLTGRVFGRLTVVGRVPGDPVKGRAVWAPTYWACRCECGTYTQVDGGSLAKGNTVSCGCFKDEVVSARQTTHGASKGGRRSGAYCSYLAAKRRCTDPRIVQYSDYGGRGIEFRFNSFEHFFAEVGHRPFRMSIDRIDNAGHYEPGNVKWSTRGEQNSNQRPRAKKPIL